MNLNSIHWSQAQELLLQLVQVLSPLAERSKKTNFLPFFFAPPEDEYPSIVSKNPVWILSTLQSVQRQVQEWVGETAEESRPAAQNIPVAKQAKLLVAQVQKAIGELVSSSNLRNQKEEPLREVMKKLSPEIDHFVQSVTKEGIESILQQTSRPVHASFRFSPTPSSRERLILKKDSETTIPLVPFVPMNKSIVSAQKRKKKKGFWSRREEEDQKNS